MRFFVVIYIITTTSTINITNNGIIIGITAITIIITTTTVIIIVNNIIVRFVCRFISTEKLRNYIKRFFIYLKKNKKSVLTTPTDIVVTEEDFPVSTSVIM